MIHIFPCLNDNYGLLLHDQKTGLTASIDTPDGQTIADKCEALGIKLTHIFNTHHHFDHTDGNLFLKEKYGATIIGAKIDEHRIPGIDITYEDGDMFSFGDFDIHFILTPGHTLGHCAYYVPALESVFVGDTMFALGCGRVFEGTHEQMFDSIGKLAALPDNTQVYCAHEYTLSNGKFALGVDGDNQDLINYMDVAQQLRARNLATVPTTIGREKAANPFVRAKTTEEFTKLRTAKDRF